MAQNRKILVVDDDSNLRSALRRTLRQFDVRTAANGTDALNLMRQSTFAVCVADMHMPAMSGLQLLARLREERPATVRVMFTGDSDLRTAMQAVNEGQIFRFIAKPCPTPAIVGIIAAAIEQHRLIVAERELLEETVRGVIRVLTDVLSMVNPVAFSRTLRVRAHVTRIAEWCNLPDRWQYDVAASLSHLGCISLTPEILETVYAGGTLSFPDQRRYLQHASIAHGMLANIPRFDQIAEMIAHQNDLPSRRNAELPLSGRQSADVGASMLKVAIEFERLLATGRAEADAIAQLRARPDDFDSTMVTALECSSGGTPVPTMRVAIRDLQAGAVVAGDVRTHQGMLLVGRGQEVTRAVLARLQNFSRVRAIPDMIEILPPTPAPSEDAAVAHEA